MANDPVLIAYAVRRNRSGRVNYTRIGQAYPHNVGEGLTLILEALPLPGGHIILLELDESDDRRLLAQTRRYDPNRPQKTTRKASAGAVAGQEQSAKSQKKGSPAGDFQIRMFHTGS